jgi:predicted PurR-regulated permease PerM
LHEGGAVWDASVTRIEVFSIDLSEDPAMPDGPGFRPQPVGAQSDHQPPVPLDARARTRARTVLTIALVCLALWIAGDFLPALGWSGILAIGLWPLYARSVTFIGTHRSPTLAPLLFTLLTGLIVLVPVALAAQQIAQQGGAVLAWAAQARDSGVPVPGWINQLPLAAAGAQQLWEQHLADPKRAASLFQSLNVDSATEWTRALGGELLHRAIMFALCLIALFNFLRHGPWIVACLLDTADRILGDPGERLASKMVDAVRGTLNGTVLVAVAEGLLIGAAYVLAGVPSAALLTLLTIAFAMVPFGAWAAFTAGALALVVSGGSPWAATAVFVWGAAVMLLGDHFVWPSLVGSSARLPFLLAFVGVFGGLQVFGLIGLVLGPVIMAAVLTIWREWLVNPRA